MGLFEALHQTGPGEERRDTTVIREGGGGWGLLTHGFSGGENLGSYLHIKFLKKQKTVSLSVKREHCDLYAAVSTIMHVKYTNISFRSHHFGSVILSFETLYLALI